MKRTRHLIALGLDLLSIREYIIYIYLCEKRDMNVNDIYFVLPFGTETSN